MKFEPSLQDMERVINAAKLTLVSEGQALISASNRLDKTIYEAVITLANAKGKVVVTGLGKSGYVGRKIAATFASTGRSACFLHPTEALHGDIGILQNGDVLMAIAFGGGDLRSTLRREICTA